MIVNPVRYGSGGKVKQLEVTVESTYSTNYTVSYVKNGEFVSESAYTSGKITLTVDSGSLFLVSLNARNQSFSNLVNRCTKVMDFKLATSYQMGVFQADA